MQSFVRIWILFSAAVVSAGWVLSATHTLNRLGYFCFFFLMAVAGSVCLWLCSRSHPEGCGTEWRQAFGKLPRRFRRVAPLCFLAILLLSLIGGFLYGSTNIDTAAYRVPRVLHWLGQGHWHWIYTYDPRQNSTACDFEWLAAPLIEFTGTDRFLFLINGVSYLMLPGLIFSVFRRFGVRPRVAWWWMWFLAAGWCYALQAGSTGNDGFAAVYALAAMDLALRAREAASCGDLFLSLLAISVACGTKQNNLPLLLPWFVAVSGSIKLVRMRPLTAVFVAVVALLISPGPIIVANWVHTGNWMGYSRHSSGLENPLWISARANGSPFWTAAANIVLVAIQNLTPPYFPLAERVNGMMDRFLQTPFGMSQFAAPANCAKLSRFANELSAGIGPGVCVLMFFAVFGPLKLRKTPVAGQVLGRDGFFKCLRLSPWVALLPVLAKAGIGASIARLLAAYYPLMFPLILAQPGHSRLVRKKWWQGLGVASMLFTAGLLVVSFDRPLFPVRTLVRNLQQSHPDSKITHSLSRLYAISPSSIGENHDLLAGLLPHDGETIGYSSDGGIIEPDLWFPLGSRKVAEVRVEDSPERLRSLGIRYVVIDETFLKLSNETIEQWAARFDADVVAHPDFKPEAAQPAIEIWVVRLHPG
jgi:hypothetical protein